MPPMISFYSEQIDSSTQEYLRKQPMATYMAFSSRTTSLVHVPNHVNNSRTIFPRSRNYACTLYTEEPLLRWLKDFLGSAAP
jgi:hypothetical protein